MNTKQLKELAESLNGEEWSYLRTTPYSRGYIIGKDGRTIVQTCDGEVPANVCRFIEGFDPASALMLIERMEAAERERDELRERLSLVREQRDAELNKNTQLEAELARRDAVAAMEDKWIPVSERMPDNGLTVLVCQEGGITFCAEVEDREFYPDEFPQVPKEGREITHWMDMPEPPAAPAPGDKK